MAPRLPRFAWIVLLAAAYALAGKAGLLLAIPPGYATAVWPPSGIAAAALLLGGVWLWPGVLLGSVAVNLWMSGDFSSTDALSRSALIAGGIGAGATLQAVLAASLVRMAVPHLNIFRLEAGVIRLLLLAGPVACVVNATIGVSTLFIAGLIPAEGFLFNWWTWWIGDSIGVLVFLPLVLIWEQRPYRDWWNKQVTVSAPTLLIFVAVVCLFFFASAREERRIRSDFESLVAGAGHDFARSAAAADSALRSVAGFIEAAPDGPVEGMQRFTESLLDPRDTVLSELQYLRVGADGLRSRPLSPGDTGLYATDRAADHRLSPELAAGLDRVRAHRQPATVVLPAVRPGEAAVAKAIWPVRAIGDDDAQPLAGFLVATVQYGEIAWRSFRTLEGIEYAIRYTDAAGQERTLVDFAHGDAMPEGLRLEHPLRQGGGTLRAVFRVAPSYFVENRSWQAWGLLAVGLVFTAMLCMVMLVLIGREARVEEIVAEKTRQLRRERHQISNLMATFPDPHFVTDDRGRILEVNAAALKRLSRSREELVGTPVQDCFQGDILALIRSQLDVQRPADRFDPAPAVYLRSRDGFSPATVHVSTFRTEDSPLFAITVRPS